MNGKEKTNSKNIHVLIKITLLRTAFFFGLSETFFFLVFSILEYIEYSQQNFSIIQKVETAIYEGRFTITYLHTKFNSKIWIEEFKLFDKTLFTIQRRK